MKKYFNALTLFFFNNLTDTLWIIQCNHKMSPYENDWNNLLKRKEFISKANRTFLYKSLI